MLLPMSADAAMRAFGCRRSPGGRVSRITRRRTAGHRGARLRLMRDTVAPLDALQDPLSPGTRVEHFAEVLENPEMPLAVMHDQAGAGQVF
jgi:hypothetical protein